MGRSLLFLPWGTCWRRKNTRSASAAAVLSASELRTPPPGRAVTVFAKEDPFYVDATSKTARVKAAQLDLARASARMREALVRSGMLERPPPRRISSAKLSCLGRACGLPALSDSDEKVDTAA